MANKNNQVVIAYFPSADKADAAANQLKDWDKANVAVKLGGIGILAWEDDKINIDARVGIFIIGYSISPAMVMNMVGKGSKYPFAYRDADGDYLSGSKPYRLPILANVPAANFWSVTLYDASNASGLDNDQPFLSIGSLDDLQYNADGSVDLYFGPDLPANAPESNWLRTVPGRGWFTLLRLYSPTEPFFDQSWRPGDFEKIG